MNEQSLSVADLEEIYRRLAEAIDQAGPDKEALLLTKIVLLLANRVNGIRFVHEAIDVASKNL